MKKVLCASVIFALIVSLSCPAFAWDTSEPAGLLLNDSSPVQSVLDEDKLEILLDIPVYVTHISETGLNDIEKVKEQANEAISEYEKQIQMAAGVLDLQNETAEITSVLGSYRIDRLFGTDLQEVLQEELFENVFYRVSELIDSGVAVKNVNLFIPRDDDNTATASLIKSSGNADDESYWLENTYYLGYYDGYYFRYLDSSVSVESDEVVPGNLTSSWNWSSITSKTFEIAVDHFADGDFFKAVTAAVSEIADLLDIYSPPLAITYGTSSGYIKGKVSGDLYIRQVFIKDVDDRIDGYAYYGWSTVECLLAVLRIDAKWPVGTSGGAYIYEYPSFSSDIQESCTDGYGDKYELFPKIITRYENTVGYFPYSENINVESAVATLLS